MCINTHTHTHTLFTYYRQPHMAHNFSIVFGLCSIAVQLETAVPFPTTDCGGKLVSTSVVFCSACCARLPVAALGHAILVAFTSCCNYYILCHAAPKRGQSFLRAKLDTERQCALLWAASPSQAWAGSRNRCKRWYVAQLTCRFAATHGMHIHVSNLKALRKPPQLSL